LIDHAVMLDECSFWPIQVTIASATIASRGRKGRQLSVNFSSLLGRRIPDARTACVQRPHRDSKCLPPGESSGHYGDWGTGSTSGTMFREMSHSLIEWHSDE